MKSNQKLLWKIETECEKWQLKNKKNFDLKQKIIQSNLYHKDLKSKYLSGFWFEDNLGNNSFVFKKGRKIFIPPLKFSEDVNLNQLKKGEKIVFRDQDENKNIIEEKGLKTFLLTQGKQTGLPIYIVDNHNWVFYAWSEIKQVPLNWETGCVQSSLLVHIDAHKDEGNATLKSSFSLNNLTSVVEQTKSLKVSNYIYAAVQAGLIQKKIISLTSSKDFESYAKQLELLKQASQNIILNVDIDIFAPEVSTISLEEKVKAIGYFAKQADLITFATSPGFIDQEFAIEIVKILIKKL